MGAEPGVGKAEVPRLRVSAVIVLSNCLLAIGLLRAERLSSSCVACSLSCVVGVVLSLAHSWGGCGTAAVRCPTSSNQGDKGNNSRRSEDHTAATSLQIPSQSTCSLSNSNMEWTSHRTNC